MVQWLGLPLSFHCWCLASVLDQGTWYLLSCTSMAKKMKRRKKNKQKPPKSPWKPIGFQPLSSTINLSPLWKLCGQLHGGAGCIPMHTVWGFYETMEKQTWFTSEKYTELGGWVWGIELPGRELSLRKEKQEEAERIKLCRKRMKKIDEAIGDPAEKPSVTCASPKASPEVKTIKGE